MGTEQRPSANSIRKPSSAPVVRLLPWRKSQEWTLCLYFGCLFVTSKPVAPNTCPPNVSNEDLQVEKKWTQHEEKKGVLSSRSPNDFSQDHFLGSSRDQTRKLAPRYSISCKNIINTSPLADRCRCLWFFAGWNIGCRWHPQATCFHVTSSLVNIYQEKRVCSA